jgi:hypothetical protein
VSRPCVCAFIPFFMLSFFDLRSNPWTPSMPLTLSELLGPDWSFHPHSAK